MQEKVNKIFKVFCDSKNINLYQSCLSQLIQINQEDINSQNLILHNAFQLILSKNWDVRIQGVKILENCYQNFIDYTRQLIESQDESLLENYLNLFDRFKIDDQITENTEAIYDNFMEIRNSKRIFINQIDLKNILDKEFGLFSCDAKVYAEIQKQSLNEDQLLQKFGVGQNLNYQNYKDISDNKQENEDIIELINGKSESKAKPIKRKYQSGGKRGKPTKAQLQEKQQREQEQLQQDQIQKKIKSDETNETYNTLQSPFTRFFNFAVTEMFNAKWEIRLAATMVLKILLRRNLQFINLSLPRENAQKSFFSLLTQYQSSPIIYQEIVNTVVCKILILISLDRFADFLFDKSYAIVREKACECIVQVIQNRPDVFTSIIEDIFLATEILLSEQEWQIQQSGIQLLKYILISSNLYHEQVHLRFKQYLLTLMTKNDELQLLVAESVQLYLSSSFLLSDNSFLSQYITLCWDIIGQGDELNYSISTLLTNLQTLSIHKELSFILNSHSSSVITSTLQGLFMHSMQAVRSIVYSFTLYVLDHLLEQEQVDFSQLVLSALQNLVFETDLEQQHTLAMIVTKCVQIEDRQGSLARLTSSLLIFFKYAITQDTKSMLKQFVFKSNKSVIMSFYQQPMNFEEEQLMTYLRIEVLGGVLGTLIGQPLKEKGVLQQNLIVRLRQINNYNVVMCLLIADCQLFSQANLETLIQLDYWQIEREDLDQIKEQINKNCHLLIEVLNKHTEHEKYVVQISHFLQINDRQTQVSNFEKMYKFLTYLIEQESALQPCAGHTVNCIKNILILINNYVQISSQLAKYVKTLAAFQYQQMFLEQNKPPSQLNLVIKQFIKLLQETNTKFMIEICCKYFMKLVQYFDQQQQSPFQKIIKSILSAQVDSQNSNNFMDNLTTKSQNQYLLSQIQIKPNNIKTFFNCLFNQNDANIFQKYQFLNQIFFEHISQQQINTQHISEDLQNHLINEFQIVYIIHEKLQQKKYEEQLLNVLNNIIVLISIKNIDLNTKNFNNISEIFKNLLAYILQNQHLLNKIQLQEFYLQLKNNNVYALKILEIIFDKENQNQFYMFSPLFIKCIIKKQTHSNCQIQQIAQNTLSQIINVIFLTEKLSSFEINHCKNQNLIKKYQNGKEFLMYLKNIDGFEYDINFELNIELRNYQKDGIKWLGFLTKYNFNGALCDDMGLGKTIQTLIVLQNEVKKIKTKKKNSSYKKSLIICPQSLTDHWQNEILTYCDKDIMKNQILRIKKNTSNTNISELFNKIMNDKDTNFIIMSEKIVLQNIQMLIRYEYLFIVIDEGHSIKNHKSKFTQAVKQLQGQHKFLLSGTPIQNNLLELWSIFDYLMPGYLGSISQFKANYSKLFIQNIFQVDADSILFSEQQKKTLQELHVKIKPFILRRTKDQVLKELPEKTIQDYESNLSEQQEYLYDLLESKEFIQCESSLETHDNHASRNVFELLTRMHQICNHPQMTGCFHPQVAPYLASLKTVHLYDQYKQSCKFISLKDLLESLGFVKLRKLDESIVDEEVHQIHNPNKILIFSRFRATLDLIARLLLDIHFQETRYMKITGSIDESTRFQMVQQFNRTCNINILLLTTQVGGLGLNLTSANTVIMFDHDFNPMKDMQAIDRAHRIGQKNKVCVYRMIANNTLEQKIMGIQQFKKNIVNSVINQNNASLDNVKQSKVVELFMNQSKEKEDKANDKDKTYNPYNKILSEVGQLWSEEDYKNTV